MNESSISISMLRILKAGLGWKHEEDDDDDDGK